jgi:hypothetical protein
VRAGDTGAGTICGAIGGITAAGGLLRAGVALPCVWKHNLPTLRKPSSYKKTQYTFCYGASNRISTQRHELDSFEPGLDELFFRSVNYRKKLLCTPHWQYHSAANCHLLQQPLRHTGSGGGHQDSIVGCRRRQADISVGVEQFGVAAFQLA